MTGTIYPNLCGDPKHSFKVEASSAKELREKVDALGKGLDSVGVFVSPPRGGRKPPGFDRLLSGNDLTYNLKPEPESLRG